MTQLRWILVVCGALLLVGIYLWGRRSSRQAAVSDDSMLRIPEPTREPHSAYVDREYPEDDLVATESALPDPGDEEPISANRRHRDLDDDEDTIDVIHSVNAADEPPIPNAVSGRDRELRRTRIEPTFGEDVDIDIADHPSMPIAAVADTSHMARSADKPVDRALADRTPAARPMSHSPAPVTVPDAQSAAPTLSMSSTPQPRRTERRKIIALRIAAGAQRFTGEQLLEGLLNEGLQHGKYDVFHRLDEAGSSIFSIASMVEPGTFDPPRMQDETYPGITMFAQMPGPIDSLLAFNELVLSARRLQEKLGGTLQDERGVPLTIHRVERLRQDVRDFEQGQARESRADAPTPAQ